MKSHAFFFFALIILCGSDLYAQWEQIGPSGGDITALAVIDSTLFAGTHGGGVFRSTDMGSHWVSVSTGLSNGYINALIVRGRDLLAGTPLGIFRLPYNGGNWVRSDSGISKMDVLSFTADATSFFAGTEDGYILRSTDNGISWDTAASLSYNNTPTGIYALKIAGQNLLVGAGYATFRISNLDQQWSIDTIRSLHHILSFASSDESIYAGTWFGIYQSTDHGTGWSEIDSSHHFINSLAVNGSMLMVASHDGVFYTNDNGKNWSVPDTTVEGATSLIFNGTNIFAGSVHALFRSGDSGSSWTESFTGISNTSITSFATLGTNMYIGTWFNGIVRTSDQGTTWTYLPFNYRNTGVSALVVQGATLFAGTTKGVFLSSDNGNSWNVTDSGLTNRFVNDLTLNGSDIFAGTYNGVFRYSIAQSIWSSAGLQNIVVYQIIIIDGILFASTDSGIFRSTDYGASWSPVNTGLKGNSIASLALLGTTVFLGNAYGVFQMSDTGSQWTPTNLRSSTTYLFSDGTKLFAGNDLSFTPGTTFLSLDSGNTWRDIGQSSLYGVSSFYESDIYVFAGSNAHGIWRRPLSTLGVTGGLSKNNSLFILEQNYPNPFKDQTTISFSILKNEKADLKVLDQLGNEVATLATGIYRPGNYDALWDAKTLPAGIYYARLQVGASVGTKKLVIAK